MANTGKYDMTSSLFCEIWVKGSLNPAWQEWFEPLMITTAEQDPLVLVLSGCLPDQAALHATLEKLYALNLPLVSVKIDP